MVDDQVMGNAPIVMFLNLDIKAIRTGVENAALLRATMFEAGLGIVPEYLTANYHPYFAELHESLLKSHVVTPQLRFRNLYDYFQGADTERPGDGAARGDLAADGGGADSETSSNGLAGGGIVAMRQITTGTSPVGIDSGTAGMGSVLGADALAFWDVVRIPGTEDLRIRDRSQRIVMYRKTSRATGRLEYINYFHDRKIWRRDSFDTRGWLSRIQILDEQGQPHYEHYLRPDGSTALIQWYAVVKGKHTLRKIQLMSRDGFCTHDFSRKEELVALWLRELTADRQQQFVMIVDRNRIYHEPLCWIREAPEYQGNISVISVVHAVHTRNGFDIERSTTNSNYASVLNRMDSVDALVVLTEKQRRDILARYGSGKIAVIPHAFDAEVVARGEGLKRPDESGHYQRGDCERGGDKRGRAVYLARYSSEKRQALAIEAFAQVVKVVPDARLDFYGHGKEKAALQKLVTSLGLEKSVFLNDFVQDVAAVYRQADVAVLTSQGEGFSLFVLESLSHGCPVVAFDVNYGPSDVIQPDVNGYLVPFGDVDMLAQRLIDVLGDSGRQQRLAAQARPSVERFTTSAVIERWRSLLQGVISKSGPQAGENDQTQTLQDIDPTVTFTADTLTLSVDARSLMDGWKAGGFGPASLDREITSNVVGRRCAGPTLRDKNVAETFQKFFEKNLWGNAETVSGGGSSLAQTETLRAKLPSLLHDLGIQQLLDLPCGDFHWMRHVDLPQRLHYLGGEIVPALVAQNQERYASERIQFRQLDLLEDPLPKVDLVLCRDCLVHLPFQQILEALRNLCRSGSQWLLTTTFPGRSINKDIAVGKWRPLNLELEPFRLPPPTKLLIERCPQGGGKYADKSLGLWRLSEIEDALKTIECER